MLYNKFHNLNEWWYIICYQKDQKKVKSLILILDGGYPKETCDDHWCYILKDYGTKYLIIPTTSIKSNSAKCNPLYEMDIIDKTPTGKSRLQFTDMRSIDIMRVCRSVHPNCYDVITDRKDILQKFQNLILTDKK